MIRKARLGHPSRKWHAKAMMNTNIRKLVPHRGCRVGNCRAFSGARSSPFSKQWMVLCSAPWYWNTRRISGIKDTAHTYATNMAIRSTPSTKLSQKTLSVKCFIRLTAPVGRMMKTPMEKARARTTEV